MYIHIYMYVYVYTHTYIYIYIYTDAYKYIKIYVYICSLTGSSKIQYQINTKFRYVSTEKIWVQNGNTKIDG